MSILDAFMSNENTTCVAQEYILTRVKMLKGAAADCTEWLKKAQICDLQIISQIRYAFMTSG